MSFNWASLGSVLGNYASVLSSIGSTVTGIMAAKKAQDIEKRYQKAFYLLAEEKAKAETEFQNKLLELEKERLEKGLEFEMQLEEKRLAFEKEYLEKELAFRKELEEKKRLETVGLEEERNKALNDWLVQSLAKKEEVKISPYLIGGIGAGIVYLMMRK